MTCCNDNDLLTNVTAWTVFANRYRVTVKDVPPTKNDVTIIPAHKFRIDDLEGERLQPGQDLVAVVEYVL